MADSKQPGPTVADRASGPIFLSYASHDTETARSVCRYLESHGVPCWMAPRDVRPGAPYADAIVGAISEAKALVLILSGNAVASDHVAREVERAASKHKAIIAFRIDSAPLSPGLEYFLSNSQWIDVPALGMPAALAKLAEAVEQGPTAPAQKIRATKRSGGTKKRFVIVAAILVCVGVAAALGLHYWSLNHRMASQAPAVATSGTRESAASPISDKSIAVLPFTDMSEKHDQEYFGDGMAEEILDLLTKIPGLTVIGRTSSFQFKGKNEDLRTIGEKLNAAYVLEGSVRKSGDQVRITAQLINTRTGAHEWSETYDRHIGDVLKLQDAVAAAVVRELQLTVTPGYLNSRAAVKDPEVYDLILRGRHSSDRWDKEGGDEAVTLFQQALDRDATSADASAELAFAYYKLGVGNFLTPAAAFEQARRAAATALRLDQNSTLAHYVLGKIHVVYDWDWAAAEREFRQVAALVPGSAVAPNGEARLSVILGRWDEALGQVKSALARDPLDPNSFDILTMAQMRRDHLPEAEAAARRALDIRPTYPWSHWYLGQILLARGDRDAALLAMQQEETEGARQVGLAIAYYALGRKADSDAALALAIKKYADLYAFEIAVAYAFRKEADEAIHWLERAYAQKDSGLVYVKVELPLKNLEADPRYKAFLKKMNLPE
jgi:TolB-like protein/tetratricopeptide (TPR) repeat protein